MSEVSTYYVKYPRTYHVPWSPGISDDDKIHPNIAFFKNKEVVITEKMDGENTTMYHDYIHARSIHSSHHASRDWIKSFHAQRKANIPKHWRICGENLFAKHSIFYDDLPSYFLGFNIWDEKNICLDWANTIQWFELLDIIPVPVIYNGIFDEKILKEIENGIDFEKTEGYTIRIKEPFSYDMFRYAVAKYVRPNHVHTTKHWRYAQWIELNQLSPNAQKN